MICCDMAFYYLLYYVVLWCLIPCYTLICYVVLSYLCEASCVLAPIGMGVVMPAHVMLTMVDRASIDVWLGKIVISDFPYLIHSRAIFLKSLKGFERAALVPGRCHRGQHVIYPSKAPWGF